MKNYVEQKVNVAQLVLDVLCFLLAILAAAIYAVINEWRNIHSAIFVGIFVFFILRFVVFSVAEQFRTRRETALVNVPFVMVILAVIFKVYLVGLAWPFFLFVSVWFLLLIVYDIYDIKKPDKRIEHLRQKFEESQVPPPRAVSPPMRDLGAGSTPVINPSLDIPSWRRIDRPLEEGDTPIPPPKPVERRSRVLPDQPSSAPVPAAASQQSRAESLEPCRDLPQRDYQWFYNILKTMKNSMFQRNDQYADEREELKEHFKRTSFDRRVLVQHKVRKVLVDRVDKGDFDALLLLLRSRSVFTEALHEDLAKALAEGCKPRAQKVRYRRPRNNS